MVLFEIVVGTINIAVVIQKIESINALVTCVDLFAGYTILGTLVTLVSLIIDADIA